MKKALYFDCASGISGDMSVAALLDLGADKNMLLDTLASLNLSGYSIEILEVEKSGIAACDFNVLLDKKHENHDHDMEYLHGENMNTIMQGIIANMSIILMSIEACLIFFLF